MIQFMNIKGINFFLLGLMIGYNVCTFYNERIFKTNHYSDIINFRIPYYGFIYESSTGNYIDEHVIQYGAFEKPVLNFLDKAITKLNLKNGTFIDVGANTGLYSLFLSSRMKKVEAIEPYPPVIIKLENNIKINSIDNIAVHKVGLANANSSITFFEPPEGNHGVGTFSKDFASKFDSNQNSGKELKLPLVIGDEYFIKFGISDISILKIDIEGFEKYALEGLKNTLVKFRPLIILEYNTNKESFGSIKNIFNYLPDSYGIFEIETNMDNASDGKFKLNRPVDSMEQKNLVVYPLEKEEDLLNIN